MKNEQKWMSVIYGEKQQRIPIEDRVLVKQEFGKKLRFLGALALIALAFQASCGLPTVRTRVMEFAEYELPVVMFDRFKLRIQGWADTTSSHCTFFCDVEYVDEVGRSASLDSVPILFIDSICFMGDCYENQYCREGMTNWNTVTVKNDSLSWKLRYPNADITWTEDNYRPGDFPIPEGVVLPQACRDEDVVVVIAAHLCDRVSGEEIAREVKRVQCSIRLAKRYLN